MRVYPEIESWNEFYPSEIFIRLGGNETPDDAFPVIKMANIGTTVYLGTSVSSTNIYKKIGKVENISDMSLSTILVGQVVDTMGS